MKTLLSLLTLALLLGPASASAQEPIRVLAFETAPFFVNAATGPEGLEYEILGYYARSEGLDLQVEWEADFDQVLARIEAGDADVAAATLTVTPEREARIDFTASYFPVRVMLVEPEMRTTARLSDLRGQNLATMRGTTYESLLNEVPGATFVYGDTQEELFDLVASGEATALAVDSAMALTLLPKYPSLHMTLPISQEQNYAFAVPTGSPLAKELSDHIQRMKQSKIYFRLLEKHFGEDAVEAVMAAKGTK